MLGLQKKIHPLHPIDINYDLLINIRDSKTIYDPYNPHFRYDKSDCT